MEDKGDISQAKQYGWVAAGAHFLQRVVGLASETSLSDAKLPNVFGPEFMNYDPQVLGLPEDAKLFQQIKTKYNRAKAALDVIVAQGLSTRFDATDFAKDLRTGAVGNNGKTITNMLFILIDAALAYKGVWKYGTGDGLKLGVWVDSSVNPLAQFIAFGIAWVHGCLELIGMGLGIQAMAAAGAAGAAAAGAGNLIGVNMLGGVLSLSAATAKALGGLISFIGTVGLIGGVLVAFLAPLQPFLKFLFNTLTWVLGVFEAVLAVPLIAIAHLNPEGNGLPGQNARQAYFLVLNIFLRPVLMVFGLCFGILLFTIGVGLLNLLYETAGSISFSAGGPQTTSLLAFAVLTKIMMTVIYLITIYIMSNGCWKGIDYLPTQALRWMGQGAVQLEKMGDANQISQGVNTAGVFFGNQLVSQAGQVISGGEQGLSAAGRSLGSDFSGVGRWVMRPGQ
ncbi:MAG: hypothetical protein EBZ69_06920 [Alphaproteobacteria bacterium]|nr:hypothetical protein [Alphaproteobacteria bacterium]